MFLYFDFLINVGSSKRSPGCVGRGALDLKFNHANTKENMMITLSDIGHGRCLVNDMAYIYELWVQDTILMDAYLRLSKDMINRYLNELPKDEVLGTLESFKDTFIYSERMQEIYDLLSSHPETRMFFDKGDV